MANVAQQIEIFVRDEIKKNLTRSNVIKAANDAGRAAILAIQERTAAGISREGGKLPEYSQYPGGYITMSKKWKIPSYKTVKNNARELARVLSKTKGAKTVFKATGTADEHGRLTGQFFTDMFYKVTGVSVKKNAIDINIEIDVKARSAKKIEWLESTTGGTKFFNIYKTIKKYSKKARKIWGLSKTGKYKDIEQEQIVNAFNKRLKLESQIDIIIEKR